MVDRPPVAVAVLAGLVVLAGCAGPFATGSSSTDSAETERVGQTTESPAESAEFVDGGDSSRDDSGTPTSTPRRSPTPWSTSTTETAAPATESPTATPAETTPTPTNTATPVPPAVGDSSRVVVENGSLPVDATEVYRRVERLMGADAEAPSVRLDSLGEPEPGPRTVPPVERALGFGNETGTWRECGTFTSAFAGGSEVVISPGNLSASALELVLAHEFAHVVQREVEGYENATTTGGSGTTRAMLEGSAVYVAERYAQRFDERWSGKRPLEIRGCLYREAANVAKISAGWYYFGGLYFDQRIDAADRIETVFRRPPRTTEQLVHGLAPSAEPPAPLSVRAESSERWAAREGWGRQRGELAIRAWLATELSEHRVDTAATGWGNGTIVRFGERRDTSLAWVLRWDGETDADEFESALADLEIALEDRNATALRSVRVAPETVVAFAGNDSFVANATATGTNGDVTVVSG